MVNRKHSTVFALVAMLLAALTLAGCPQCPTTPPPAVPTAHAIEQSIDRGLAASASACKSPGCETAYKTATAQHTTHKAAGDLWCSAQERLQQLEALVREITAGGGGVPPELLEAIDLLRWAAARMSCNCPT